MTDSIFYKRSSKRAYLDREIPKDTLNEILEKTRWSPSCSNNQPWRFVLVTERNQREQFMTALPQGNQWAAKAPLLVAVCAREADDFNREDDPVKYYQFDCGMAVMSMLLAATEEGLMGHPMAGYDADKLHAILQIPEDYHLVCILSLGYSGESAELSKQWREYDQSPRNRKSLSEIASFERFSFSD